MAVMLDTVLPSLLPLDTIWLLPFQEAFRVPKNLIEIFLGDVNGKLGEYFNHVVESNQGTGVVVRCVPGKWMNEYTKQYSILMKLLTRIS